MESGGGMTEWSGNHRDPNRQTSRATTREPLTMCKPVIAIIVTGLLIVLTISGPVSCAGQSEALIEAARKGDLKQVQELLDKGANVSARMDKGKTALKIAQEDGHAEIVELLKAHGAKE